MNIKIVEQKANQLLKRQEVLFKIEHEGATPKRDDVKAKLAALLNSKPDLIVIMRMRSEFGKRETVGRANIYETMERLKQVEPEHLLQRGARKAEQAKAEAKETPKPEVKPKAEPAKAEVREPVKKEPKAEAKK